MEAQTELECRELLALDEKLLTLTGAIRSYKDNPKAVKCCAKIIDIERKGFKNCRAPIPAADLNTLQWRYADLADIVKRLQKTKDAQVFGKANSDFDTLVKNVEEDVELLNKKLTPATDEDKLEKAENAVRDFASRVADGARNVGEKVKNTVTDAVGKLKTLIDGTDPE